MRSHFVAKVTLPCVVCMNLSAACGDGRFQPPDYRRQTPATNMPPSILLAQLIRLSRSISPQEAGLRQIGALDHAGAQLDWTKSLQVHDASHLQHSGYFSSSSTHIRGTLHYFGHNSSS